MQAFFVLDVSGETTFPKRTLSRPVQRVVSPVFEQTFLIHLDNPHLNFIAFQLLGTETNKAGSNMFLGHAGPISLCGLVKKTPKKFEFKLKKVKKGYIEFALTAVNFDTHDKTPPTYDAKALLFGGKYN